MASLDQPGSLQHLYVLGDGRQRELEGLGELVDGRRADGKGARIARRVELANAAKVSLNRSSSIVTVMGSSRTFLSGYRRRPIPGSSR